MPTSTMNDIDQGKSNSNFVKCASMTDLLIARFLKYFIPTSEYCIRYNACPLYCKQRHKKGERQVGPSINLEFPPVLKNYTDAHDPPWRKRSFPAHLHISEEFPRAKEAKEHPRSNRQQTVSRKVEEVHGPDAVGIDRRLNGHRALPQHG